MIKSYRVIALIPARGGSKGILLKNVRPLAGKPLIAWTIELAREIPEIDRVIVSTDALYIKEAAIRYGAEVMERPAHLATDDALPADVARDAITRLKRGGEEKALMVYLEPTCPLREKDDIAACLELLAGSWASAATFKTAELHPHRAWRLKGKEPSPFISRAVPWQPRQQLEPAYQLTGAVYAFKMEAFPSGGCSMLPEPCGAVLMSRERSVDIDDEIDFLLAETMLMERNKI